MDLCHPNSPGRCRHLPHPDWVVERKLGIEPVRRICGPDWTLGSRSLCRILHGPLGRIGPRDAEHWEMVVRRRASLKIHAFRIDMRSSFLRTVEQCRATNTSWGWL